MNLTLQQAERIAELVRTNNGGTFQVANGILSTPISGFVVGGAGYHTQRTQPFTAEDLKGVLDFCYRSAFGIWLDSDTGIWHFDEVTIYETEFYARMLGVARRQIAIWNLDTHEEIRLTKVAA